MKKITSFEFALLAIIATHILILAKSTFFPYPELFVYPYLTNIGLLPYTQILDQHFPGLMFFPVNLGTLGIDTPSDFRFLMLGIVVIVHFLLNKVSFEITKSEKIAFLSNILFFAIHPFLEGNVLWIDNFLPLFMLPAFYLFLRRSARNIFLAGTLIGCSLLLKQVVLPLVMLLVIWIFINERKLTKYFLYGISLPMVALLLFVLSNGVLGDFVYWTYTFNVTTFAEMGRKYGTFRQLLAVGVIFAPAILIALYALVSKKGLLALFFLGNLVFTYARFDYVHLQPALPFAILLIIFLFTKAPKTLRETIFLLYLLAVVYIGYRFYTTQFGGGVKFFGNTEYKVVEKVDGLANDGDPIFAFGTLPHIYQMTKTRPSGNVFVFHFPWFMNEAESKILAGLEKDPPKVVIRQKSASVDNYDLFSYMKRIDKFVSENYETVDKIEDIEIMLPNENRN